MAQERGKSARLRLQMTDGKESVKSAETPSAARDEARCVRGLVVRAVDYRDSDVILTLLTATRGRVSVNARGARTGKSNLKAGSQLLTCSDYTLYDRAGKQYVRNADSVEQFVGLRRSIEVLSLAVYFCEVLETVSSEEVPSDALLTDALNALYALSSEAAEPALVKAVFELRVAAIAGWTPDAETCPVCGEEPSSPELDVENGAVFCAGCGDASRRLPLCTHSLAALRYVLTSPSKRMLSFKLTEGALERFAQTAEVYLLTHADKRFASLEFYKSMQ